MAKAYPIKNLGTFFDLIPENLGWNYLRADLEPRYSSNTNLCGTVKIHMGMPSVVFNKEVGGYGLDVNNLIIGTEGRQTIWEKVEIEEDEPYWVNKARWSIKEFSESYRMIYIQLLFGAYHVEEGKRWCEIRVEGFDDGKKYKKVVVNEGMADKCANGKKLLEGLIKKFEANFGKASDSF